LYTSFTLEEPEDVEPEEILEPGVENIRLLGSAMMRNNNYGVIEGTNNAQRNNKKEC
jgi:hypothetical protein